MKCSRKTSHLNAIRDLVENLSDRDIKIKRDIRLFEEFFKNFPIPVSIWTLSSEGALVSQRGNGIICKDAECIQTLFENFDEKDNFIKAHKQALEGKNFQKILFFENKTYYISIGSRRDENDEISGVIGLAWDVTPNNKILECLEEILRLTAKNDNKPSDKCLKMINKKASEALTCSRLHNLIKTSGD